MAHYAIPPLGPGWQITALVARYRFAATIEREVIAILEAAYREIATTLRASDRLTRTDRSLLEDRFLEIRRLLTEAYGTAQTRVTPLLREYAALEDLVTRRQLHAFMAVQQATRATGTLAEFATTAAAPGAVTASLTGLPRQLVISAARAREIVDTVDIGGIGFGEWWTKAREDGIYRVRRLIQTGIVQGQHPTQIASRIWATAATGGPNAWRQSRTVAETAARTVVAAIQTDAQLAAEAQFPQAIYGYVFRAVIDTRTSSICRSLDGSVWKRGDPQTPIPPLHPNCRSTLEPIVDLPGIGRSTSKHPSYETWLRAQPPTVQNAVLGRGIAEHFRAGRTNLADLLSIDRRPMGLAQLRAALTSTDPASYVAWIASLPMDAQRAVLGPTLAKRVQQGTATIAEVLDVTARAGMVARE